MQQIADLLRPEAYTHAVRRVELRETHLSWVLLTGQFAYKIRKSVRFDFIDQRSPTTREHLGREELRLNQRLTNDLYLGMVPIRSGPDGRWTLRGIGPEVEYAVQMRQFNSDDEMPRRMARGMVTRDEITDLGRRLAAFHAHAPIASNNSPYGAIESLRAVISQNVSSLTVQDSDAIQPRWRQRLLRWTEQELDRLQPVFAARKSQGHIREGHGDLHGRNIVWWQGHWMPFDALEFDPALRWIDVINDIAFLFADLLTHERKDLAYALMNAYLEFSGDYAGLPLLRFYSVYRALVRAKVDGLQLKEASTEADPNLRMDLRSRQLHRVRVAEQLIDMPRPALILMHGHAGSGKTWVSERLLERLPAMRVRSDVERKRLAGSSAASLYAPETTQRTYNHLLALARATLEGGFNLIVDANFATADQRAPFRGLARALDRTFLILSCHATRPVMEDRVQRRAAAGNDASDADLAVLHAQLARAEPLPDNELRETIEVNTTTMTSVDALLATVNRRLSVPRAED
jgi:aminoglycoside phosphotransferase family enzyme/predicted kinase